MAMTVLVVDDATFMRHMLKKILSEIDCEVIGEAADGDEAVTKYKELKPDIVTLDLVMPKVGGIDALKEIREADSNARVIIVSAIDQREPLMEALKLGAVDYVVKPFEKDRIEEAVQRVRATCST